MFYKLYGSHVLDGFGVGILYAWEWTFIGFNMVCTLKFGAVCRFSEVYEEKNEEIRVSALLLSLMLVWIRIMVVVCRTTTKV